MRLRFISIVSTALAGLVGLKCITALANGYDGYVVKPGETLSEIIWQKYGSPLYGRGNYLEQIAKKNKISSSDKIYPGQEIKLLPPKFIESAPPEAAICPVVVVPIEAETQIDRRWKIGFTPKFIFSKIDVTDSSGKATLLSNLSFGSSIFAERAFADKWHYSLGLDYEKSDFLPPENKTLTQSSNILMGLFFGVGADLSERLRMAAQFGLKQELFLRGASSSSLALDKVLVPRVRLGLETELTKQERFSVGLGVDTNLLFPVKTANYDIKQSIDYCGKIFISKALGSQMNLRGGIFYRQSSQSTSIVDQVRSDTGVEFSLTWRLGL